MSVDYFTCECGAPIGSRSETPTCASCATELRAVANAACTSSTQLVIQHGLLKIRHAELETELARAQLSIEIVQALDDHDIDTHDDEIETLRDQWRSVDGR